MTELNILFVNDINNEKLLTYFINDDVYSVLIIVIFFIPEPIIFQKKKS